MTFHIAGVVPVNGQPLDFGFPWHDCLQPIAKNFLAVERAVLECAYAGCNTIWIICPPNMQPLIRYRLGDFIEDPKVYNEKMHDTWSKNKQRPIYYVPGSPKDQNERDSLVWNIIYGCKKIQNISQNIAKWLVPIKYYISFPYGVHPPSFIADYRSELEKNKRTLLTLNNKSIKNGDFISACIDQKDIKYLYNTFRSKSVNEWVACNNPNNKMGLARLPLEQRYTGRFLTLKDIFENIDLTDSQDSVNLEVPWHYNINTWEGLCLFLGSPHHLEIERPNNKILNITEMPRVFK